MWKSLIEKAGFTMADVPKTWDAYFDFFRQVQDSLRKQGMRKVYGLGFQVTANGVDPNNLFQTFLIANGGKDWVTPDGRLHLDDPTVRQAVIRSMTYLAMAYKDGYVPPSAINWNDADDNNAFHAQQMVMDVDGTLSTEVAIKEKNPDWYFNDIRSQGIPLDNQGKPVPSLVGYTCGLIPKGAKNVAVAKEFLKYFIQPEVTGKFIETGLGRWLPVMPELAKSEFWRDPKDPHLGPYIQQGLLGPTVPYYYIYNPAVSEVDAHHFWSVAIIEIMSQGAKPEEAAKKAFEQIEAVFAKYVIAQS
jgi:multiple sugar transport system substrate-binding protein